MSNLEQLELVSALLNLFEDPDISVYTAKEPGCMLIGIETNGRKKRMEIKADGLIGEVRNGDKTLDDIARAIVTIYDALFPFPDCEGSVVRIK